MKHLVLIFITGLLCLSIYAQGNNTIPVQAEGTAIIDPSTANSEANKILLYEAFKDALNKSFKELGLGANSFWTEYQIKFDEYNKLSAAPTSSSADKNDQERILANNQREFFASNQLNSTVVSYIVKERSISASDPKKRFIKIEANMNSDLIKKIYYLFVKPNSKRSFNKLYLTTHFILKDLNWSDLGVKEKEELTSVIDQHWNKNLTERLQDMGVFVENTNKDQEEKIEVYASSPRLVQDPISEDYSQSLWLIVSIDIRKKNELKTLKQREYEFDGSLVAYDLTFKRIIFQNTMSKTAQVFPVDTEQSASQIASFVHSLPLSNFGELRKSLDGVSLAFNQMRITISNYANLKDVYAFQDLLKSNGTRYNLQSQIESIRPSSLSLLLSIEGDQKELDPIIAAMDQKQLKTGKKVILQNKQNPYSLTFKDENNGAAAP